MKIRQEQISINKNIKASKELQISNENNSKTKNTLHGRNQAVMNAISKTQKGLQSERKPLSKGTF